MYFEIFSHMKRTHLFAFQIAFTILCYFCIGNVFAQNKVKQSLFLAGNTASQHPQQYNRFISELTKLNHSYSFIYLGNFSSFNQVDEELYFSFYPENIQYNEVPFLFAMGPNEWKTGKKMYPI